MGKGIFIFSKITKIYSTSSNNEHTWQTTVLLAMLMLCSDIDYRYFHMAALLLQIPENIYDHQFFKFTVTIKLKAISLFNALGKVCTHCRITTFLKVL